MGIQTQRGKKKGGGIKGGNRRTKGKDTEAGRALDH